MSSLKNVGSSACRPGEICPVRQGEIVIVALQYNFQFMAKPRSEYQLATALEVSKEGRVTCLLCSGENSCPRLVDSAYPIQTVYTIHHADRDKARLLYLTDTVFQGRVWYSLDDIRCAIQS